MTTLFDKLTLKSITLKNRIAVSPMCQYSAEDGVINDWHLIHLGSHAIGGAGLIVAEATAVAPEGRITPGCTGLWNDTQAEKWPRVVAFLKQHGSVPGIQIAHAGRKASANRPWEGDDHMAPDDPRVATDRPERECVRREPVARAQRNDEGRYRSSAGRFRRRREPCARRRLRPAGAPLRAWLSGTELLLAHRQQAHRRIWRQLREPHPLLDRDARRRARGVAGASAAHRTARHLRFHR